METAEVRDEVKQALIRGDLLRASDLLRTNTEAFTMFERIMLYQAVEAASFGRTNPAYDPELAAAVRKL